MSVLTKTERRKIDIFMGKHIGQPNIVSMYNDWNSIMKVVDKLEFLCYNVLIEEEKCTIPSLNICVKVLSISKFEAVSLSCFQAVNILLNRK